ncbi:hypothetical protein SG34_007995 [Thalassomonas viridans]|uniref:Uncharacterized protein n=1 Tax=Thalassomonas viridans TaxID=137584 RepID=A0AAE9Z6A9_9GAMM|nr:hypothetical protein [Thalassomonas viridans]WDE06830.1 hypothetical protein SG34_007995 [Thalassomonas viridans]
MISNRDLNGENRLASGDNMDKCAPMLNNPLDYHTDKIEDVFGEHEFMDDDSNSVFVRGYN